MARSTIHRPGPCGRREAHPLQLLQAADGEAAHLGIVDAGLVRPQDDEADVVRRHLDRSVEAGPTLRVHLPLQA
jgi:hypothetical protein